MPLSSPVRDSETLSRLLGCIAAGILILATVACDEGVLSPTASRGVNWRLFELTSAGQTTALPASDRYTLRLDDDGRLRVQADCNACGGSYALQARTLSVPDTMACTRAFCGTASLDTVFLAALGGTHQISVTGDELTLRQGQATLRFRR